MADPLSMLAILAAVVAGVSVLLARLIPDEYDRRLEPEPARARRTHRR